MDSFVPFIRSAQIPSRNNFTRNRLKNFFYARRTTDKRNDSRCYFGATAITGTETRRKSGEDKREFAELLLRDWLEFEGRRKQHTQKKKRRTRHANSS